MYLTFQKTCDLEPIVLVHFGYHRSKQNQQCFILSWSYVCHAMYKIWKQKKPALKWFQQIPFPRVCFELKDPQSFLVSFFSILTLNDYEDLRSKSNFYVVLWHDITKCFLRTVFWSYYNILTSENFRKLFTLANLIVIMRNLWGAVRSSL